MLYNQRGYGESSGIPSEKGVLQDIEAVYDYLSTVQKVPDDKLVARGFCLSGGIVAALQAKHPRINIILDQTYADIRDICLNTVLASAKDLIRWRPEEASYVKEMVLWLIRPLLALVVRAIVPKFRVADHIRRGSGNTFVLYSTEDTFTPKSMARKIVDALAERKAKSRIHIGHMPGIHGTLWLDAKTEGGALLGRYHVLQYLQENGLLDSSIDGGQSLARVARGYEDYLISSRQVIGSTLYTLPESRRGVDKKLFNLDLQVMRGVAKSAMAAIPLEEVEIRPDYFRDILLELNRLKKQLGGSPNYGDGAPTMEVAGKTFFGIPEEAVKDWFRMVISSRWKPRFFWRTMAGVFGVKDNIQQTDYERAHLHLQHYGMLFANKKRIMNLLDRGERYNEFSLITGLAWHPKENGPSVEKMNIELLEQFLTTHFLAAKAKGERALLQYFRALQGVCFENRMSYITDYLQKHAVTEVGFVADWDTSGSAIAAFNAELMLIGSEDNVTSPLEIENIFRSKGLFNCEFTETTGREKPSATRFHEWILPIIDLYTIDPYPTEIFLTKEYQVFKESGKELTARNFREQLALREGLNQGFDPRSGEVEAYLERLVGEGLLLLE